MSKLQKVVLLLIVYGYLVFFSVLYAQPLAPDTPIWNLTTDVITFTVNASPEDPVKSFSAVLYDGTNSVVSTYSQGSLNLTEETEFSHNFHAPMVAHSKNTKYHVVVSATNDDGTTYSNPSVQNVKGMATFGIGGNLDFGENPNLIIFKSSGNHTAFEYDIDVTSYNYALRYEVKALSLTFPSAGQYRLSGYYHGSTVDTLFAQSLVTGEQILYLREARSSAGRDGNGQPNSDSENNVITIVVNPGNADFETTYTLRFRRRLFCPVLSLSNISHSSYAFSCSINGDDSGSPKPSDVNGDTIATIQSIVWAVNPISGTAYFDANQMHRLSSGDIKVIAKTLYGRSVSLESGTYSITGISNYSPHLGFLELRNAKLNGEVLLYTPDFSSDPAQTGVYHAGITGDYSSVRLTAWAPSDCQLYLNGVRIANRCQIVLKMEPTTINGDPSNNTYVLRVENSQGHKDYTINIQREVNARLIYGRTSGNTPHLAATSTGDIFGMNSAQTNKLTVQAWVRWTSPPATADQWANIASQTTSGNGTSGVFWLQHNNLNTQFEFAVAADNRRWAFSDPNKVQIQQGVWYHVTGVYNGTHVLMYVDGEDVTQSSVSLSGNLVNVPSTAQFNVGKMPLALRRFPGNIRDLKIWVGTARTPAQIAQDYAGTSVNNADFSWPLNESSVGSVTTGRGSVDLSMTNVLGTDFVACCQNNIPQGQTFLFRPSRIDLSSASSESVFLVHVNNYNSAGSRFSILGPETNQALKFQTWDHNSKAWAAPASISEGVQMDSFFGDPSGNTRFWVPLRLNTSSTGSGRYVDDGGAYDGNDSDIPGRTKYNTILPLPPITAMTNPFTISGRLVHNDLFPLTAKYVILGYDQVSKGTLITACSSVINAKGSKDAGDFALKSDVTLKRIEFRTQDDILITSITNSSGWSENTDLGETTLPVQLTSFNVFTFGYHTKLTWITASESNVAGYYIYRATENNFESSTLISPLISAINSPSSQQYSYFDDDAQPSIMYYYWLQSIEYNGDSTLHGPVNYVYIHNEVIPEIPLITGVKSVHPNPFNPHVNIAYSIKIDGDVEFEIYNLRGQLIDRRRIKQQEKGTHQTTFDLRNQTSGVYLLIFKSGKVREVRKICLSK